MSRRRWIRNAVPLALAIALSLVGASEALASHEGKRHRLVVKTIPALKGVPVKLDKKGKKTGRRGLAILSHPGTKLNNKRLRVKKAELAPGVRTRFGRWYGNPNRRNVKHLTAALNVDYEVGFSFVDGDDGNTVDASDITEMVVRSSIGQILEFDSEALTQRHWLHGTRVVSRREGPFAKAILYSIERVVVNGSNVVNRAQQRFSLEETRDIEVTLLYFTATFRATDALFGNKTGSGIRLQRPDGVVEHHAFDQEGELVLAGLPRGEYFVEVIGPGPSFERPITLTRDQDVELDVLSWLDIGVTGTISVLAVIGLIVIGRPHLARLGRRRSRTDSTNSSSGSLESAPHSEELWEGANL